MSKIESKKNLEIRCYLIPGIKQNNPSNMDRLLTNELPR